MPNFQRSNMPIPNYPPQRASIQTNHYPNHHNQHNHQKINTFQKKFLIIFIQLNELYIFCYIFDNEELI